MTGFLKSLTRQKFERRRRYWETEAGTGHTRRKTAAAGNKEVPFSPYSRRRSGPAKLCQNITDPLGSTGAPKTTTDDTLNAVSDGLVVDLGAKISCRSR